MVSKIFKKTVAMLLAAVMAVSLIAVPGLQATANEPGARRTVSVRYDENGEHRDGLMYPVGWWSNEDGTLQDWIIKNEGSHYGVGVKGDENGNAEIEFKLDPDSQDLYSTDPDSPLVLKNAVVTLELYDYGSPQQEGEYPDGRMGLFVGTAGNMGGGGAPFGWYNLGADISNDEGIKTIVYPAADIIFGMQQWWDGQLGDTAATFNAVWGRKALVVSISIEFDGEGSEPVPASEWITINQAETGIAVWDADWRNYTGVYSMGNPGPNGERFAFRSDFQWSWWGWGYEYLWIYHNGPDGSPEMDFHFTGCAVAVDLGKIDGEVELLINGSLAATVNLNTITDETGDDNTVGDWYYIFTDASGAPLPIGDHTLTVRHTAGGLQIAGFKYLTAPEPGLMIATLPDKLTYMPNEVPFDTTGLSVLYTDASGSALVDSGFEVSGYDPANYSTDGVTVQTITVTYNNVSATFNITMLPMLGESIEIAAAPVKYNYAFGTTRLDLRGLSVIYNDGTGAAAEVPVSALVIGDLPDPAVPGVKPVLVTYNPPGGGPLTASFDINTYPFNHLIRVDRDTHPHSGPWSDFEGADYGISFRGGSSTTWGDGWSWIYNGGNLETIFTFTGGYVAAYLWRSPTSQIMEISINGEVIETVDLYRESWEGGDYKFEAGALGLGEHTLSIKAVGVNPAAGFVGGGVGSNHLVAISAFEFNMFGGAGIMVSQLPDSTLYRLTDAFDPAGLEITYFDGTMAGGEPMSRILGPDEYIIDADDLASFSKTLGTKEIRISFPAGGDVFTTKVNVRVELEDLEAAGLLNLARLYISDVTASSDLNGTAWSVINNVYQGGYSASANEWAAAPQDAGRSIRLSFEYPVSVRELRLYGRNAAEGSIANGQITYFAGGTEQTVDAEDIEFIFPPHSVNPKTPVIARLTADYVEWIEFKILDPGTGPTGLAEFQAWGPDVSLPFMPEFWEYTVAPGQDLNVRINRNQDGLALSGEFQVLFPEIGGVSGWAVVSGSAFADGSAYDILTLRIPDNYIGQGDLIRISPVDGGGNLIAPGFSIGISVPDLVVVNRVIYVIAPDYYSSVGEDGNSVTVTFIAPGISDVRVTTVYPDAPSGEGYGEIRQIVSPGDITFSGSLNIGSFTFDDLDQLPYGPVSFHIYGLNAQGATLDHCYVIFFNEAGVNWFPKGADNVYDYPEALIDMGYGMNDMPLVWYDDFASERSLDMSPTGRGHKYASLIPRGDSSPTGWAFSDTSWLNHNGPHTSQDYGSSGVPNYVGYGVIPADYTPFSIEPNAGTGDGFLRIENKEWHTRIDPVWNHSQTTGFLSSQNRDMNAMVYHDGTVCALCGQTGQPDTICLMGGYNSEPGLAYYFEAKMFLAPNPGLWPAFWSFSLPGEGRATVELDTIEAYMGGINNSYGITTHYWSAEGTNTHFGAWARTNDFGSRVDLTEGWHTYGVLVEEDYTTYFFDGQMAFRHRTYYPAWVYGSYMMVQNAFRRYDEAQYAGGFTRYGDTSQLYVDWWRAFQVTATGFTPLRSEFVIEPGQELTIEILRGRSVQGLSGMYEVTLPPGMELVSGESFTPGERDSIVVRVPQGFTTIAGEIVITPVVSGTPHPEMTVSFVTTGLYDTEIVIKDDKSIEFTYRNLLPEGTLTDITVTPVIPFSGWDPAPQVIDSVAAGESVTLLFADAPLMTYELAPLVFSVEIAGFVFTIHRPASFLAAPRLEDSAPRPNINGVIDGTWDDANRFNIDMTFRSVDVHTGFDPDYVAGTHGLLAWDDDYLYLAVHVNKPSHTQTATSIVGSWTEDSLQISFDPARGNGIADGGQHISVIAALSSDNRGLNGIVYDFDYDGGRNGQPMPNTLSHIVRDEDAKTTVYTFAFGWDDIVPASYKADFDTHTLDLGQLGISICLNVLYNGRRHTIRYMDGIASGKLPQYFGDLVLSQSSDVEQARVLHYHPGEGGRLASESNQLPREEGGSGDSFTVINPGAYLEGPQGTEFLRWNTAIDGSGTSYMPGDIFTFGDADVTLFAIWGDPNIPELCPDCGEPIDDCICDPGPELCPNCGEPIDDCICGPGYSIYDLSKTGSVTLTDLAIVALAAGITKDDPRWHEQIAQDSLGGIITPAMCDFDGSGEIDMLDLMELFRIMYSP